MKQALGRVYRILQDHKWFCSITFIGLLLYLVISISKHLHFGSTGYDLVIFDQAVRNYSLFSAPASTFRGFENLLGDHFHPILAVLAPLYWIADTPIMLLIAQALLIVSAAIPVYLYGIKKLSRMSALFVVIAFILNAALLRAIYFDFHEIAFAIPLIAWAIYFIETGRWKWLYASLALLLLTKETFGILAVFFGLYLLAKRQFYRGTAVILVGVASFLLITKVVIPYFAGGGSFNYWTYDQLGSDLPSAIGGIITNPLFALSLLFLPAVKIVTFIKTFGIFFGFTFLSPIIILAVPLVLERFLSSNSNYWQFHFHYGATVAPILAMAFIDGVDRLTKYGFLQKYNPRKYITYVSGGAAAVAVVLFAISPMTFIAKPSNWSMTNMERSGYSMISSVKKSESVCATNHIAPHLGAHNLYLLDETTAKPQPCNVIIYAESLDQVAHDAVRQHIRTGGYEQRSEQDGWYIYAK
ncbi:MAG: DUF2079 domain-containing protein [Chloroflexi bacterium]|nr:MAG: DUF2079 domain-containing protein [Chloroflexota bacterium]